MHRAVCGSEGQNFQCFVFLLRPRGRIGCFRTCRSLGVSWQCPGAQQFRLTIAVKPNNAPTTRSHEAPTRPLRVSSLVIGERSTSRNEHVVKNRWRELSIGRALGMVGKKTATKSKHATDSDRRPIYGTASTEEATTAVFLQTTTETRRTTNQPTNKQTNKHRPTRS